MPHQQNYTDHPQDKKIVLFTPRDVLLTFPSAAGAVDGDVEVNTRGIVDIAENLGTADDRAKQYSDRANAAMRTGAYEEAESLYELGQRWREIAEALRGKIGTGLRPRTGGTYLTRGGHKVGPLRPFRDGEDGDHTDAVGRSAWFFCETYGAFDSTGAYLSGHTSPHGFDCLAEWREK